MANKHAQNTPVGSGSHVVRPGECMLSIASAHGFLWETLWNLGENSDLKDSRKNPNVLLAGDRVTIPKHKLRTEAAATGKQHRFRIKIPQPLVRLCLQVEGNPLQNVSCRVSVDQQPVQEITTQGDGTLEIPVAWTARSAHVECESEGKTYTFVVGLGDLDPSPTISGVAQRLSNLGWYDGPTDSSVSLDHFGAVLKQFQSSNGLDATGAADEATCDKLRELHGS